MESEHSQNFNERLSQWVAGQGFWFQIRYSMTGSTGKGTIVFHLLRMGFRVMVFLLVIAIGIGVYLLRRTGTKGFNEGVKSALKSGLSASEIELRGVANVQGVLGINGLACKGGDGTFFSTLEARNIRCNIGFLDGIVRNWNPGTVTISRFDADLRAGTDDDEAANRLADALFKVLPKIDLSTIEVSDATLRWGYGRTITPGTLSLGSVGNGLQLTESGHTLGSITNSFMRVLRTKDELRLSFKGGQFSQNWLHKLDIVNIEVVCNRDGMLVEKAEFRKLQGTVDFSGLTVKGGARPLISGTAKVRNLALASILPLSVRDFVEGTISGDFQISGSTNSSEGIVFDGAAKLDSKDMISMRERLHLLKALSVVDYSRNYHRIDFREGSFHLKSGGGGVDLTDINLKSDDDITLVGNLKVKLPNAEEIKATMDAGKGSGAVPIFDPDEVDRETLEPKSDVDFTLRRAALEAKREKDAGENASSVSLFDKLEVGLEMRRLEEQITERLSRSLRYEGAFTITLPPDAFERAPKLASQYPVDSGSGRIPVRVPIEGQIFEITFKQAEDIYLQGKR
jgi:hypothetical protein